MSARFASALSAHPETAVAVGEAVGAVLEQGVSSPDLAVVMFTRHHVAAAEAMVQTLDAVLRPGCLVGASASGVLACGEGREHEPGLTLWTANLDAPPRVAALDAVPSQGSLTVVGLNDAELEQAGALILWADPWSFPIEALVNHLAQRHPHLQVIGGAASAGDGAGTNRLVMGSTTRSSGAVAVLLPAGTLRGTVVSQGCRPIGQPWTVTRAHANVIEELGGQPAWRRLFDVVDALDEHDRALAMAGLHCGLLADDRALDPTRGDFLVRGVLAADQQAGTVSVSALVPVGTVVQFHVRDSLTAGQDLERRLADMVGVGNTERGALVFTCNGRGRAMFDTPHHDARIVQQVLGSQHSGMLCAGEIGPVAGRTYLHGFTASVAVF